MRNKIEPPNPTAERKRRGIERWQIGREALNEDVMAIETGLRPEIPEGCQNSEP